MSKKRDETSLDGKPEARGADDGAMKPVHKAAALTAEEKAEVAVQAREQLTKETKKALRRTFLESELARLRQEEGLVVGGAADEAVDFTLDLPAFCDKVLINGRPYWHGHTYRLPRHVADTLRDIASRAWRHQQTEMEGKKFSEAYRRKQNNVLSGRGQAAAI